MAWRQIAQLFFCAGVVLAQTLGRSASIQPASSHVGVEEILSYECARSITTIVDPIDQMGPLFSEGLLVFTSLEAQDASKILLVNAGYGNYAIILEGKGVNRIRFEVPTVDSGPGKVFYLSYFHGGTLRSRYFEFSEGRPPIGHDELDYSLVSPRRADNLLPHLDYAIHETAEATLNAITDGRLKRSQLMKHRIEGCDHISRQSPGIAKNLRHSLDLLDIIVMGPSRVPASVASKR